MLLSSIPPILGVGHTSYFYPNFFCTQMTLLSHVFHKIKRIFTDMTSLHKIFVTVIAERHFVGMNLGETHTCNI